jgi:hypothetical protein
MTSMKMKNGSFTLYKGDLKSGVYILEVQPVKEGAVERIRLIVK